ncbi:MAG: hypothetical protein ABDI07_07545 [Candidatus Kryptonium sp.]
MIKISSIVTALILFFSIANSQDRFFGGYGYFTVGVNFLNLDEINRILKTHDYAQFKSNFLTIGGAGGFAFNRILIGGEGFALIGQKQDKRNYRSLLSGGGGFFNAGYIVYERKNFQIYPMIGIGGGGLNLKLVDKRERSFNEAIANPKSFDASNSMFMIDVSGGLNWKFGYFIVGIKTGYVFSPAVGSWKTGGEVELQESVKQGINGFYFRVSVGGGGGRYY